MAAVKPIPDNYPRAMPYLVVDGASDAIAFYRAVFGATERFRMPGPGDTVGHAELDLGDSVIMLADAPTQSDQSSEATQKSPKALGGTTVSLMVYVEDVDGVFKTALENGAKELRPLTDQFYGDRSGTFEDPWGHQWTAATHVEDVSEEEMARRAVEFTGG